MTKMKSISIVKKLVECYEVSPTESLLMEINFYLRDHLAECQRDNAPSYHWRPTPREAGIVFDLVPADNTLNG